MTTPTLPPNIPKRGLSYPEAAEYLGVSEDSLRDAIARGLITGPRTWGQRRMVFDRRRLDADLDRLYGVERSPQDDAGTDILRGRLNARKAEVCGSAA